MAYDKLDIRLQTLLSNFSLQCFSFPRSPKRFMQKSPTKLRKIGCLPSLIDRNCRTPKQHGRRAKDGSHGFHLVRVLFINRVYTDHWAGIPHMSQSEQTINGYFIPKGTVIFGNVGWVINFIPTRWANWACVFLDLCLPTLPYGVIPKRFDQNAFFLSTIQKQMTCRIQASLYSVLGQGSSNLPVLDGSSVDMFIRICAGMHLADRTALHMAITTLSLYEILPLEGKAVPRPETVEFSKELIRSVNLEFHDSVGSGKLIAFYKTTNRNGMPVCTQRTGRTSSTINYWVG